MSKADIKICRFAGCKHENKNIDITTDEYKVKGNMYYHADCYKIKQDAEWKDQETKNDLQYIKNGWVTHISQTVVYSQLFQCLNELIARGISSKYLVFVFDYVVENKMNLRYPRGFKYFVDREEIKSAYQKKQLAKNGVKKQSDFVAVDNSDDEPKFSVNSKPKGFGSILGGGKK